MTQNKPISKAKKIYKWTSAAVSAVVMLTVLAAVISLFIQVAGGKKPSVFGYRFFYILTDSMEPELMVNDVILSEVIEGETEAKSRIKEGDVITFVAEYGVQEGLTITHKVIKGPHYDDEIGRYIVLTQGVKAGATIDPPVPLENIMGVMVKPMSFLGAIYRFLTSTGGLVGIILVPFALMLGVLIYRLVIEIKTKTGATPMSEERIEEIKRQAVLEYVEKKKQEITLAAIEEYKKEQKNSINKED